MWRRTALIVVLGFSLAARGGLMGQERTCPDLLISDLNWVRFDVIMGRVVAVTNRAKQDRQRARRDLPSGTSESLAISIDRGLTSLQYVLESETQILTIRVVRREEVEVRWTWHESGGPSTMVYSQMPGEDVLISVSHEEGPQQVFQASSLWHLIVGESKTRDLAIVEVLQSLISDWRPLDEADTIRAALIDTKPWNVSTSVEEVRALVGQLADKDFRVRQQADCELRSRGRAVLCLFNELDLEQLDGEQRLRIREIRRALIGQHSDTPDRVTSWLVNDKRMWLALLNHDELKNRLLAHEHLARIVAKPIKFDPAAVPTVRSQQLATLRTQLALR